MKVTNFVIDFRRSRYTTVQYSDSCNLLPLQLIFPSYFPENGNSRECYTRDRRISVVPSVSKYQVTRLHPVLTGQ